MENVDIDSLREMLASQDPCLRRDACERIEEGRLCQFVPALTEALRDADPGVREAALNALSSIGGPEVADAMVPLLRDSSAAIRNIGIEILELLGQDASSAIATLLKDSDQDVVKFAIDIISNTRNDGFLSLLYPLIRHENPNVRASVAVCLGKLRDQESVPELLNALEDPEEWVKFSAIEGLGLMQDRRALQPLMRMTETDSGLIKEAAIDAVAKMASAVDASAVLQKLEPMVRKGKDFSTGAIVELLEKVFSAGSDFRPGPEFRKTYFAFLTRNFSEETDRAGQLKAIRGLSLLKLPESLDCIFSYIEGQNDIDEETEALLVDSIVSVSGRRFLPALKEKVHNGGKSLKLTVKALGEMKAVAAVPALKELVSKVGKNELREVVAALEAIGSPSSIEVLYDFLEGPDGHTRKIAARALASLAGPAAVSRLFDAVRKESYRDVMEEITDSLALIPADSARKGFTSLLEDPNEQMREMGARGLGLIGDDKALDALKAAARDKCPGVRKAAYKSMARLGLPYAIDALIEGLADDSDEVKLSVLKGLNGWCGEKIKAALLRTLKDRNIWVRYHSVLLLGELGEHDIEGLIIEKLIKDEAPVKAAAARALERLGATGAIGALEQFVNHPDPSVRGAVESAIETLRC
ncbi:MAG: HEAT repeat domain-containing protein [Thermodesulfobacteriota bacterium]|nr:MAG: HEAT repeat domain-containing protein [Thermodesulfobacteriota bacterium]